MGHFNASVIIVTKGWILDVYNNAAECFLITFCKGLDAYPTSATHSRVKHTPVRKVFAEREVPLRCLGGNKSTGTRFSPSSPVPVRDLLHEKYDTCKICT